MSSKLSSSQKAKNAIKWIDDSLLLTIAPPYYLVSSKLSSSQKAKNAIKWIEALASGKHKQAPKGKRGRLGGPEQGFCCLGVGAYVLKVGDYRPVLSFSRGLYRVVGLKSHDGSLFEGEVVKTFYGRPALTEINDSTNAGFKRIARLLRTKPHWMFEADVAELIAKHYKKEVK